jgi:ketosteroid isomerase-like protein
MGEARDVMNRLTETLFRKDLDALSEIYAADAVVETPDQGTVRGDAIVAYLGEMVAAFPDASYEARHEHESGNTAIDEGYFVGTNTGPLATPTGESIPATGKRVRLRAIDVATVEGGRVTSHRLYFDMMDFMEQLGLTPQA